MDPIYIGLSNHELVNTFVSLKAWLHYCSTVLVRVNLLLRWRAMIDFTVLE